MGKRLQWHVLQSSSLAEPQPTLANQFFVALRFNQPLIYHYEKRLTIAFLKFTYSFS